ncbi:beta-galactosidase [Streptomyces hainanensis]|uniref:Beta-galactosidase n=1 Tax=Streptomyces hainanensis TaxID=402648 RepID=A0A4R4TM85_9ACTN|nr:beta-galactosidase [Streptomyces hainanensis]TDC77746.1 beta-galactosidase [Streptomyces hainanensis]
MPRPDQPPPGWGRIPRPAYGADYNPEQWDAATWRDDVRLMREAGVNLVSLGIFAWSWLEPRPDAFDFTGLDEVVALLHEAGVAVDLATPTAAPPLWFSHAHPESLPVTADGRSLAPGARQAYCPSSPAYRERAALITRRLAERYGEHPAVVMWHVNNEYGNGNAHCWCDTSAAAFRDWLRATYGDDLDALNARWGTAVWGMRHSDWDQVIPPRVSTSGLPPGLLLDFYRFGDAEHRACFRAERDILRAHSPGRPVTTNFMTGSLRWADYWRWAEDVDLVSNDHYLIGEDPHRDADLALAADLARGLAGGRPWLVMEHSTSAVQWQSRNLAKEPGEMARNTLAHLARGADGALFFQWRQSVHGPEKWHSAMVPHGGEDTRIWREVTALGATVAGLADLAGSTCQPAGIALLLDYEARWALELPYRPSVDMTYHEVFRAWHRALWTAGLSCDVVSSPGEQRLLLVPSLYAVSTDTARALAEYAAGGGHLVVGPFSGLVDADDRVHPGPYPGALRELLGLRVDEHLPLAAGHTVRLDDGSTGRVWAERVVPDAGTEVESRFTEGPAAGGPAVLRRATTRYLATRPDDAALRRLLPRWASEAGCAPPIPGAGDGVEVTRRTAADGGSWLVAINHTRHPARVAATGVDLLSGAHATGTLTVPAGGVAVVREDAPLTKTNPLTNGNDL